MEGIKQLGTTEEEATETLEERNTKGNHHHSEAWGQPQFQAKHSRSEKAILGALGEFRGILGAALGVQKIILGMRNPILRMASHDLRHAKPKILGATPGAVAGIDGNPHERSSFVPAFLEFLFKNWGGPRAPESWAMLKRCRCGEEKRGENLDGRDRNAEIGGGHRTVSQRVAQSASK